MLSFSIRPLRNDHDEFKILDLVETMSHLEDEFSQLENERGWNSLFQVR